MDARNRHDALFKQVFSNVHEAADELRYVLPRSVVASIGWSTLRLESSEFAGLSAERHADLIFSADYGEDTALLHVLFEHKATRTIGSLSNFWPTPCASVMEAQTQGEAASTAGLHDRCPSRTAPMVGAAVDE